MVAPPPSSFGVNRPINDRDAIFGGPMSPQQRNPVAGPSYLDSEDKRMDGSEEFIDIKARLTITFISYPVTVLIKFKWIIVENSELGK